MKYVEGLREARTQLEARFSGCLRGLGGAPPQPHMQQFLQ